MISHDNEGSILPNDEAYGLSDIVWTAETAWAALEATPGFNERMRHAKASIDAGNTDQLTAENILFQLDMPPDPELLHRHRNDTHFWERLDNLRGVPLGTSRLLVSFTGDIDITEG